MRIVINGQDIDLNDAQAVADSGITVGGSIVAGNSYGVTGGTHEGNVYGGEADDE